MPDGTNDINDTSNIHPPPSVLLPSLLQILYYHSKPVHRLLRFISSIPPASPLAPSPSPGLYSSPPNTSQHTSGFPPAAYARRAACQPVARHVPGLLLRFSSSPLVGGGGVADRCRDSTRFVDLEAESACACTKYAGLEFHSSSRCSGLRAS